MHANHASSTRPNHGCVIFDRTTGRIHKFGISSGRISLAGESYRATSQVNKLNAAGGNYAAIVLRHFNNRREALEWEKQTVHFFGRFLKHNLSGNKLPKNTYFW